MQSKSKLVNSSSTWNAKRRYKINAVVTIDGVTYQNTTGANSDPTDGVDWIIVVPSMFWTKTGNNIRNNNVGDVELKINSSKQVSFLNSANTQVSRIIDDGSYQIFGGGLIYGNGSGCRMSFGDNAFSFASYAEGLGRYIFNPIYLNNTSGTVDIIGFQNKTINPTSGNAVFNFLDVDPIVNQSGGANGITRGIYINPTLTSAADFRSLEITGGKVIIPAGLASNEAVNKGQLDGRVLVGVNNSTTVVLSSSTLNSTYPDATTGFRVYCASIIAGAITYEKTPTGWLGFACIVP